jgi:transcriptional regulator with XRE-family HTH domain
VSDDTFPRRLRDARKAAGLTQVQLAERVGLTQGRIAQLERGDPSDLQQRYDLAVALGVDPAMLDGRLASVKRRRKAQDQEYHR